jgi:hypothetical protein
LIAKEAAEHDKQRDTRPATVGTKLANELIGVFFGGLFKNPIQEAMSVAKKTAKKVISTAKSKAKKRLPSKAKAGAGASFNEQDPKRRLGNFGGAGEHPRQGGRTSGIVGQTKQRSKTDKSGKKK